MQITVPSGSSRPKLNHLNASNPAVRGLFRCLCLFLCAPLLASAATFVLPTPNRAIFKQGAEAEYFTPTPARTWESGTFGCVRSEGTQMHEGLDIKAVHRSSKGEPLDAIYAAAAGKVAYINSNSGLSNYGKYIVLEHQISGLRIYTLYAHLSKVADGLRTGASVKQGQAIAVMGRTTNTRTSISKERGHLHFEIDFRLNSRFNSWHSSRIKGARNVHGVWNGRNLAGLDPRAILLEQQKLGDKFNFLEWVRGRTELCRVLVRDINFPFLKENTPLVLRNPKAEKAGAAGYEIALDFNGVPFQLIPRSEAEIGKGPRIELLSVNEKEQRAHPCRDLVIRKGGKWQLSSSGTQLLDLLTY